jgi:type IV pilus assembly protein PilA
MRPYVGTVALKLERPLSTDLGLTLAEVLIAGLIIGILMAIGLPTYLGARERASDRAAQSDLRTALVGALTHYAEHRTYSTFGVAEGEREIPNLEWVTGAPAAGQVSIAVASGPSLVLVGRSRTGTYFCLSQLADSPATDRGRGSAFADVDSSGECTGGW